MSATGARPAMYGDGERWILLHADALAVMSQLPAESLDALITDPPYGIGFVGEQWDGGELTNPDSFEAWTTAWATQALRVLRPGGWMAAFGATRTSHRLTAGVEDAGFEVRDLLLWLNGQGMPKSRRRADGTGTTLKPAYEPILLARRPLDGSLAQNLERHGTGVVQIDATRVPRTDAERGYWPANLVLSHAANCNARRCEADCPLPLIDRQHPSRRAPSRLFYTPKASRREREAGCERLPLAEVPLYSGSGKARRMVHNVHPTVKPLELMRWLVRLLCPPSGTVLDHFAGSGSTGAACVLEHRRFVGIERESRYVEVATERIAYWAAEAKK